MLKLPVAADHTDGSEEGLENQETSSPEPRIAFGFDSVVGETEVTGDSLPDETGEEIEGDETIQEVKKRASYVALEINGLASKLKTTVQDACELTRAHAQVQVCDEVELIVETGVKCSEQLLAKVMNLSARLDSVDEMKRNVDRLDAALSRYEKVADALIQRRRRTRMRRQQNPKPVKHSDVTE